MLIGFPVVLVLAWVFDVTPQGIRATPSAVMPGSHRRRNLIMLVATGVIISAGAGFFLLPRASARKVDKSIAVLPFESLSNEKENAYFADGVQDEILTDLARIADLKVISRRSVMAYKSGIARNLREIGQQLGVAHVLEGSVQRSGNRVRVNVQLVDTRTDGHLWAETYDRDLADVFAIQSEIAKTIADQLEAKLSPSEKGAIESPPTRDIAAFELYTRAKNFSLTAFGSSTTKANLLQAAELLNQAVARDPSFLDAYCLLAFAHDAVYFVGFDHTPARLAQAESAVQAASRLRPNAGKITSRTPKIFIGDISIMMALWLSWKLPAGACPMIRE
jgi:TolB-like protein